MEQSSPCNLFSAKWRERELRLLGSSPYPDAFFNVKNGRPSLYVDRKPIVVAPFDITVGFESSCPRIYCSFDETILRIICLR